MDQNEFREFSFKVYKDLNLIARYLSENNVERFTYIFPGGDFVWKPDPVTRKANRRHPATLQPIPRSYGRRYWRRLGYRPF